MDHKRLEAALSAFITDQLARDLVENFLKIRLDAASRILERSAPGKFVETFIQCLQYLATGAFEARPDVDGYLSRHVENEVTLPEGLRVCGARIARSMYTMRNKRSIAHKNPVDPNTSDLAFLNQSASWIVAEILRNATGITMQEAGDLIELVQAPVGTLVEEIDGTRLVHAELSLRGEVLILLHSHYPEYATLADILRSCVTRNNGSVRNKLRALVSEKKLVGDTKRGYRLTSAGYADAVSQISAAATG